MKIVRHRKSNKRYIKLGQIINATNKDDGQSMILYCGKYRDKFGWGFFVREKKEFEEKFS